MELEKCKFCGKLNNFKEDEFCWNCQCSYKIDEKKYKLVENEKEGYCWTTIEKEKINKDYILKNIKKQMSSGIFGEYFYTIILTICSFALIIGMVMEPSFTILFLLVIMAFATYLCWKSLIEKTKSLKHIEDHSIFKIYGGTVEQFTKIIKKIYSEAEYVYDQKLIISNEYIVSDNDFTKLIKFSDVTRVYKVIHKTNGGKDWTGICFDTKYGYSTTYQFYRLIDSEKNCDLIFDYVIKKCTNAQIGYNNTPSKFKLNFKKIKEKKSNKSNKSEYQKVITTYSCPNCHKEIDKKDPFCKHCGNKINW